jgi:hypothetical protein
MGRISFDGAELFLHMQEFVYALSWIAEDKLKAKKRSRPTEREVNTAVFSPEGRSRWGTGAV